jgi:diguanylate cyclase (GGDEF)-like protein
MPLRVVVISIIALAVPIAARAYLPHQTSGYEVLLWLLPLIPAFLWAYYRGWKGAALGFAGAMAILSVGQVVVLLFGLRTLNLVYVVVVVAVSAAVSAGIGIVSELLHRERDRAMRMAFTDDLTGLPNRRHFDMLMEYEFAAARRGRNLVVVLFDLDHFKSFNDRFGHGAGDEVLRGVGEVLRRNTRKMHLTARIGGEEFITVLGDAVPEGAQVFVGRVQAQLAELFFRGETVTLSAGLAAYSEGMVSAQELVDAADSALYRAKDRGGNCVVVAGTDVVPAE